MNKNGLEQRIAFHKQQIVNAQNAEIQTREAQRLATEESQRLAAIDKQRKEAEIIAATRENFKGSGIIETLEEIRDKQILTYRSVPNFRFEKKFLSEKRVDYNEITPATIYFGTNTVRIVYDYWHRSSDNSNDSEGNSLIFIEKIDNDTFKLKESWDTDRGLVIGNAQTMIDNVARIVAENQIEKQTRK